MKKFQLFSLLLLMAIAMPQRASAEYYGIKVGGVSVTSDNCDNITGSNIKQFSRNTNSIVECDGDWFVRYDPSTKTLTLHDVLINRTGSGNRAILNESCDGLTIVFEMQNCLKARDASPLRFNANTTITSTSGRHGFKQCIDGSKEDGLTIGNGAKVFIKDVVIRLRGFNDSYYTDFSTGIIGATSTEELYVSNARLNVFGKKSMENVRKLSIINSSVSFNSQDDGTAFIGLEEFYLGEQMLIEGSDHIFYSAEQKSFWDGSKGRMAEDVIFDSYVDIDETHFPDAAFRNHVSETYDYNLDGKLALSETYWIYYGSGYEYYYTEMEVPEKGISSLAGLEYFPFIEKLDCSKNNLTSLDLSQFFNLKTLDCSYNQLTKLNVTKNDDNYHRYMPLYILNCRNNQLTQLNIPRGVHGTLDCCNNLLTYIDFSNCSDWLKEIKMTGNRIDAFMTETLRSLPDCDGTESHRIYITSNTANDNVCTPQQAQIAQSKGWYTIIGNVDEDGNVLYNTLIGGSMITSANCDDLTVLPNVTKNNQDGYARYDAVNGKLCLSGVDIVNEEGEGIKIEKGIPTIELGQDPVNITSKGAGILYDASISNASTNALLTITSKEADWYSEKLNIVSQEEYAIKSCGKLTLMGVARVEVKSLGKHSYPVYLSGNLTVKNDAELRIKANGGCSLCASGLVLEDDNIVVTPEGATIPEGERFLRDAKGRYVSDEVVIGKLRNYNYYVAGTRITNANQHAVLGDTTIVFQEPTHLGGSGTLVLTNAKIEAGSERGIMSSKTIYLQLVGESTINTTKYGIDLSNHYCFVDGPGSLYIKGQYGIRVGKLDITDAQLTVEGTTRYAINANEAIFRGKKTIVRMRCEPDADGTFKASTSLTLEDGLRIEEPAGASFNGSDIVDADGNIIKDEWVTIMKVNEYDIYIAGERVTDKNKDDVMGDGTISYDPETNTLTLNGANIETETEEGIMAIGAEINIKLEGENNITGRDGLYVVSANIEGPGSLNAKGEYCAIRPTSSLLISGDAQVTAEGISSSSYAISTAYMTISGAETIVSMKGTLGTYSGFAPVLNDGLVIGMPIGAYYNNDTGRIVNAAGEAIKDEWVIIASQDYIDGIDSPAPALSKSKGAYNLAGQLVGSNYKGIIIENGRKVLRK